MRPFGRPKELEQRRLRALAMLEQGLAPVEVARWAGVDRRSVRRWQATVRSQGRNGLRALPACGRTPRLDADARRQLRQVLAQGALAAGFPTSRWTGRRVAQLIEQLFGVSYHPDHVGRILHSLGFGAKRSK